MLFEVDGAEVMWCVVRVPPLISAVPQGMCRQRNQLNSVPLITWIFKCFHRLSFKWDNRFEVGWLFKLFISKGWMSTIVRKSIAHDELMNSRCVCNNAQRRVLLIAVITCLIALIEEKTRRSLTGSCWRIVLGFYCRKMVVLLKYVKLICISGRKYRHRRIYIETILCRLTVLAVVVNVSGVHTSKSTFSWPRKGHGIQTWMTIMQKVVYWHSEISSWRLYLYTVCRIHENCIYCSTFLRDGWDKA